MDGTNGDYQQFRLLTPKFQHINVDTGENSFCVDALSIGSKWSPVNSAADVLCVIVQRLCVCWLAPEYALARTQHACMGGGSRRWRLSLILAHRKQPWQEWWWWHCDNGVMFVSVVFSPIFSLVLLLPLLLLLLLFWFLLVVAVVILSLLSVGCSFLPRYAFVQQLREPTLESPANAELAKLMVDEPKAYKAAIAAFVKAQGGVKFPQ